MSAPEIGPDEALAVLLAHLRQLRLTTKREPDEAGAYFDANGEYSHEPTAAPALARQWAREMLSAAGADGLGGCRMCCQ